MNSLDTLQLDSALIASWKADGRYDYDREMVADSRSLLEWIMDTIKEFILDFLNTAAENDVVFYLLVVLGAALMALLVWLVWRYAPRFFMKEEENEGLDYDVEQDTIYGIDFEATIAQALREKDYRQAIRLLYLQTLKRLSDAGTINWQPSKTPMQYARQVGNREFSELSRLFILVRYGNHEATESLFQQMKTLQVGIAAPQHRNMVGADASQRQSSAVADAPQRQNAAVADASQRQNAEETETDAGKRRHLQKGGES